MNINAFQKKIRIIIPSLAIFTFVSFSFAFARMMSSQSNDDFSDTSVNPAENGGLGTTLQSEARAYRAQGIQQQRLGNLDVAMSLYQKSITLDPAYAVPYNDLGILYEANGEVDRAEKSYLKAVTIDPNYVSAYSNLALLYENKRDLNKAVVYWQKRVELGDPNDPWTEKARQRLKDIKLSMGGKVKGQEDSVLDLVTDVATQKDLEKTDGKVMAMTLFKKAKDSYKKGDGATAIKLVTDAQQLDPTNPEIQKFAEDLELRLLSQ